MITDKDIDLAQAMYDGQKYKMSTIAGAVGV